MKHINVGIINLSVTNNLKQAYFLNEKKGINNAIEISNKYLTTIKSSPLLQMQYMVMEGIKNKFIDNELAATRYIDKNISLFECYTTTEYMVEQSKLESINVVINTSDNDTELIELYNSINNLIFESIKPNEKVDVDTVHENFMVVLNYIKKPLTERQAIKNKKQKESLLEDISVSKINDSVIKKAIQRYNEKYDKELNESDKDVLYKLIKSNDSEKRELFEQYKDSVIEILKNVDDDTINNKKTAVQAKIEAMVYTQETVNECIIKLHELKTNML
jgi:hypothetical protein